MAIKLVVFTGAGAGHADGAPLQTDLFRQFFSRVTSAGPRESLAKEVARFFEIVFGLDVRAEHVTFPTFEESLGILELALSRAESIVGLDAGSESGLRRLKRQLILALPLTVARSSTLSLTNHSKLVRSLRDAGLLGSVTFVTTNYDTLLDDAIEAEALTGPRGTGSLVDYGFSGLVQRDEDEFRETRTFSCYKIHGSLNWLQCTTCSDLHVTYESDGVTRLVDEPQAASCPTCDTPRTPIIVPPTYYKDVSNVYLGAVWNHAFRALRDADRVVFCGYSFPDADMHVKYLVKRAQLNRDREVRPLSVVLVINYAGKPPAATAEEYGRFSRFMGEADLTDTALSFEQFAGDPRGALDGVS